MSLTRRKRPGVTRAGPSALPTLDEETLHRAVVAHLRTRAKAGVYWIHVPNGGERRWLAGAKLVGLGAKPGFPDLLLIKGGHAYVLELKAEGGRLAPAQVNAQGELARAGATVGVAWGLDGALAQLQAWDVIR